MVAFVADKLDIGYRRRVVKLQGIGIQAQKTHVTGSKGEIFRAEYLAEHIESRSQTIMVAQQADKRHLQSAENVALFLKFQFQAEVGHIARVKHEIQVIAPVQGLHGILRFIVPALCVTDYGKPDFLFSVSSRFNPFNVPAIHVRFSVNVEVVRVIFNHVASAQQQNTQAETHLYKAGAETTEMRKKNVHKQVFFVYAKV